MASSTQGPHSLAFRVMRLCRPSFQVDNPLLLDPADLLVGEDIFDDQTAASHLPQLLQSLTTSTPKAAKISTESDLSFRSRFLLHDPSDAIGVSGLLVLPQSFGAIYLGETFCSYISINNSSKFEATDVVIKAEMRTDKQRILLLDTTKSPVESIRAGGRYDFIVEHDVKELGEHQLVCSALYSDGDGERKFLPQFFKFVVANPLSVRTKVRLVKPYIQVSNSHTIRGGIHNFLYQLKLVVSHGSLPTRVDGSNILGKLQITWRTNLGEPGRLQTQNILGSPFLGKEIELQFVEIPSIVVLEIPFLLQLQLSNQTDRKSGPFEVWLTHNESQDEKAVFVNGLQRMALPVVEAFSSIEFNLNLVATKLGVQKITGITVFDSSQKKLTAVSQTRRYLLIQIDVYSFEPTWHSKGDKHTSDANMLSYPLLCQSISESIMAFN